MLLHPAHIERSSAVPSVIDLATAKAQARVSSDHEDTLIDTIYVPAASATVERLINRPLVRGEHVAVFTKFAPFMCLTPDVHGVSDVTYFDAHGQPATASSDLYDLVRGPVDCIALADGAVWPSTDKRAQPVSVRFTAGWATAADVPAPIRVAALLIFSDLYDNRQTVMHDAKFDTLPDWPRSLLAPYRVPTLR